MTGAWTWWARSLVRRTGALASARLLRLNLLARTSAHQQFGAFVKPEGRDWQAALAAVRQGRRVIVATNTGGHFGLSAIDRLLAVALTLRGASVMTVLCDRVLPACQMCEASIVPNHAELARNGPPGLLCGYCYGPANDKLAELDLPVATLGDHIRSDDRQEIERIVASLPAAEIPSFVWRELALGEQAMAGALRFVARGTLEGEALGTELLRRYLAAAMLTAIAYDRLFESLRPDVVVAHHGIYVPQGIVTLVARARGIRTVAWNPTYRKHCFIFSHDATYHHTLMDEPVESWRDGPFSATERENIEVYLKSRWYGTNDWLRFHRDPDLSLTADLQALGLKPDKPLIVAMTNVFWDAQLHYPANAFASQRDWLVDTIRWFAERPDLQLVIRVHPAEVSGSPPSRQRAQDEIAATFPILPDNVKVVPPESALSTYALAERADAALIYATKMGVELSGVGMPVIVAGEAWVRNKGFTFDATSRQDYLDKLGMLPIGARLSPEKQELALRYAHHFFFRRMLPISFVNPHAGPRRFSIDAVHLDMLRKGADPGLDVICDGILAGSPFLMRSGTKA